VLRVTLPPATEDATEVPVTASIAESRCATVSPTPILVPELLEPATKVKVVPFTTSVSPVVMPLARSFDPAPGVPDSSVAPVILTAVPVLSFSTAVVAVTLALVELPSRLSRWRRRWRREVTLDFVE